MDLSNQLVGVLTDHKRRVAEEALKAGRPMPEVVFPSTTGGSMDADNLREDFARILKRAGVRKVRFHDIRHTYARILLQRNENITCVSRQMGHSSMKVTIDTYGHLIPCGTGTRSTGWTITNGGKASDTDQQQMRFRWK